MLFKFNRPAALGGHDYPKGTHEVPDSDCQGWFFLALKQNGAIVQLPGNVPAAAPESPVVELDEQKVGEAPAVAPPADVLLEPTPLEAAIDEVKHSQEEVVDHGQIQEEEVAKGSKKKKKG